MLYSTYRIEKEWMEKNKMLPNTSIGMWVFYLYSKIKILYMYVESCETFWANNEKNSHSIFEASMFDVMVESNTNRNEKIDIWLPIAT